MEEELKQQFKERAEKHRESAPNEAEAENQTELISHKKKDFVFRLGAIKRIVKNDPEVAMIAPDALIAIAKATELFVQDFTQSSQRIAKTYGRKVFYSYHTFNPAFFFILFSFSSSFPFSILKNFVYLSINYLNLFKLFPSSQTPSPHSLQIFPIPLNSIQSPPNHPISFKNHQNLQKSPIFLQNFSENTSKSYFSINVPLIRGVGCWFSWIFVN